MTAASAKKLTIADYRRIARELNPSAQSTVMETVKQVASDALVEARLLPTDVWAAYKVKLAQRLSE